MTIDPVTASDQQKIPTLREPPISGLPDEILQKIFGYLSLRDFQACACVNRRWNLLCYGPSLKMGLPLDTPEALSAALALRHTESSQIPEAFWGKVWNRVFAVEKRQREQRERLLLEYGGTPQSRTDLENGILPRRVRALQMLRKMCIDSKEELGSRLLSDLQTELPHATERKSRIAAYFPCLTTQQQDTQIEMIHNPPSLSAPNIPPTVVRIYIFTKPWGDPAITHTTGFSYIGGAGWLVERTIHIDLPAEDLLDRNGSPRNSVVDQLQKAFNLP